MANVLLPGGAQAAISTTESVVDLTVFAGDIVAIWCDEQDFWFSGALFASGGTLITSGIQVSSRLALVADRCARGTKVYRRIGRVPYLVVKSAAGVGTLKVKPVER